MRTRQRGGRRRSLPGGTGTTTESGGDVIGHEAVRETESDATDTGTVHARATGGEMTTEMTDEGIGQGAVSVSDKKTVQNVGANATQMENDQDRARGITDVTERLEASLRTIGMSGGLVKISIPHEQT